MQRFFSGRVLLVLLAAWIVLAVNVGSRTGRDGSDLYTVDLSSATSAESDHGAADSADAHESDAHESDPHATDPHEVGAPGADHGDAGAHGEAGHGDGEHGDGEHHGAHLPSFLDFVIGGLPGGSHGRIGSMLNLFAPAIFGIICAILIALIVQAATRNMTLVPGRLQNGVEIVVGGLYDFLLGILGPEGKRFIPFLGTLFVYIWFMNMLGLVPFMFAATSRIHMTVALAICVFLYLQFSAVRMQGIGGYVYHLAGEPRDALGWGMSVLMFPLHIIGEIAKPFSLSVRLFGNIFGEETLIAVFVGLGAAILAFLPIPLGIPIHLPFVFLSLLMGTIQAGVFMILSTIYFALVLPHGHEDH